MILLNISSVVVTISIMFQAIEASTPCAGTNQNVVTKNLKNFRTNDFITFYGYLAEEHHVITPNGYKISMFRCNSKNFELNNKRVALFVHGIVCSSDDIVMNVPGQGLAYVLADAGYDVWIPNNRGNFYSRENLFMDPEDPASGFWDFSWDDIAFEDLPVLFNYIQTMTCQSKFYVIAHSKGTSSMLALLSSRPEFNDRMHAVSLMAPVGYVKNSAAFNATVDSIMRIFQGQLPQVAFTREQGCSGYAASFCATILIAALRQKNNTMIGTYFSHFPSGCSTAEIKHYHDEVELGYFGNRTQGCTVPSNYPLNEITAPISIHYAVSDILAVPKDVEKTLSELTGTKNLHIQKIYGTFNHQDFIWGTSANEIVYSDILAFFRKFY